MTTTEVQCPKCHGGMWDNRATKRNPKQPDFKCKDKACDGVIWPPKGASPYAAPAAPASNAKQPFSSGGPLPWEAEIRDVSEVGSRPLRPIVTPEYGDVAAQQKAVDALTPAAKLDKMFALYAVCYAQAHQTIVRTFASEAPSQVAVCAAAATLFIAAKERGLAA